MLSERHSFRSGPRSHAGRRDSTWDLGEPRVPLGISVPICDGKRTGWDVHSDQSQAAQGWVSRPSRPVTRVAEGERNLEWIMEERDNKYQLQPRDQLS